MSSFRNKHFVESQLGRLLRGWNGVEDEFGLRLEELEDRILLSASPLPVLVEQTAVLDAAEGTGDTTNLADTSVESTSSEQSTQSSQLDDNVGADLTQETTFELVFIDDSVTDKQTLLDDLSREIAGRELVVIELDSTRDGVDQITRALEQYRDVDAVHIVTHGDNGAVQLGNTWIDLDSLNQHAPALLTWQTALTNDADILFYGCDLAETETGQSLVEAISLLTGADVAASTDDTGGAIFGGDWDLEFEFGEITTSSAFSTITQGSWQGLLTTVSFQNDVNGYISTVDTYLTDGHNHDHAANDPLLANANDPSQTLIRFDDLFGTGPNAIPPGATIDSVTITLQVLKNDAGPVDVSLHRMLQAWDELSTWDDMVLGISMDDVEAQSTADAIILGQATESTITLTGPGLVETVQAWVDGETNYGWTLVTNSTGKWEIASSENADVSLRPKLSVTYTPNTPPVGQNDTYTINEETTLVAIGDWFDGNWTTRTKLSFNNLDRTESFADFPVLVELDATRIDYSKVQANGEDLRFVDHDGTVLSYEIESWDPGGTSYVWVKIPMVDAGTDADFIWMYYGNDTAVSGENAADVWSSSYQTVYHLDGDIADGATVADSFGNFDGTNYGTTKTDGFIGDGQAFDAAAAQYIDIGSNLDLLRSAESATLSLWVNPTTNQDSTLVAVSTQSLTVQPRATLHAADNEYRLDGKSQDSLFTSTQSAETSNSALIANTWQHVVGVIDYADDRIDIYVNGVLVETRAVNFSTTSTPDTNSTSAKIGTDESALFGYFDGLMDEVRIAETERSAQWIEAQYASMTGAFVNYGISQQADAGVLVNDLDPDGQTLTATLISGPSHSSSFSLQSDGSFTYTPVDDYYGTDTFVYEVSDGFSTSTATATINVLNVNDALVWAANQLTISEDDAVQITASDIAAGDVDNTDAELIFTVTAATHGHFTHATDLSTPITSFSQQDILDGNIYFVHDQSETAPTYTLDVSDGDLSAGAVAGAVTYFAINDAPTIAFPSSVSTNKNQSITFSSFNGNGITFADVDTAGQPVRVTLNLANGSITLGSTSGITTISDDGMNVVLEGTVDALNSAFDGLVWSPNTGFSGVTTFGVTIDDLGNTGPTSESASATIGIDVTNQLPIADTGGPYNIGEGETVVLDATGSSDLDDDSLSYSWDLNNDGTWDDVTGVAPTVTWSTLNSFGIANDGSYTIQLRVDDGDGGITTSSTTLNVINAPPEANDDSGAAFTTSEGTAFSTGSVLDNDFDPSGVDYLFVDSFDASGLSGQLTYFNNGVFQYDPQGNFDFLSESESATEQFTYIVSDGEGGIAQATVTLTITGVNDPPTLVNNHLALDEGDAVTLTIANLSGDDVDGTNADLIFHVSNVNHGFFELASAPGSAITSFTQAQVASSEVIFVHDGSDNPPTYDVSVSDGSASTTPVAASITFNPINDAPTISNIADQTINEDEVSAPIPFTIGDSETDPNSLIVTATSNNQTLLANSKIVISGTGANRSITLEAKPNQSGGPVTVTISVSDGSTTTQSTFDVTIIPTNDAPQISSNTLVISEGETVTLSSSNLTATDVDSPNGSLEFTVSNIQHGFFALTASPTMPVTNFSQNQVHSGAVIFVHDGSEFAPAYEVTVSDGDANTGPIAASIDFTNLNDAPTITPIADQTINEDETSAPISFTIGDEETLNDNLTITVSSGNQSLLPDGNIILSGTGANRTLTLLSAPNENGGPVTVTLAVSDGSKTTQTSFDVTITPVNDTPQLGNNSLTIDEGETVTLTSSNLSATDPDNADGNLQFSVSNVQHGHFALALASPVAITTFDQSQITSGEIVFVHDGTGTPPSYDVSVSDGNISTAPFAATINFNAINDPPTITAILPQTITEDVTSAPISFTIGDSDNPLSGLTVTAASSNQSLLPNANIVLSGTGATRSLTLLSAANQSGGPITVTLSVSDGLETSQTTFDVTILPSNDPPQVLSNSLTIEEGQTVAVTTANLNTSDIDSSDNLLIYSISNLQHGHFALASTPTVAVTSFTQLQIDNGEIVFVHDGSETAPAYDVTVSDGTNSEGPLAATITFTNKNDTPTISAIADQILTEDTPSGSIAFTVGDVNNPVTGLTITATSSDPSLIPPGNIVITGTGANRSLTITPASDQFGGPVTITLTVSDGAATSQTTFNVTVDPVNDPPVLGNHQLTIAEGSRVTISSSNISGSDVESSPQSLTFHISNVTHGYFENSNNTGTAINSFTGTQIQNGEVVFVHDGGELAPTFDIRVSDGSDSSATTAASITFTNQNDAPTISTIANQIINEDVLSSPIAFTIGDAETAVDSLIISVQSSNQTLLPDGNVIVSGTGSNRSLTLQPAANQFGGPVVITIAVSDGVRATQTSFEVTIQPVNDPPQLVNNKLKIDEGQTVTLTTSELSASDIDSSALEYSVSNIQHGYFALSSASSMPIALFTNSQVVNGDIIFVHDGSEFAPSYDISVTDGSDSSASQAASITFTNANDPPTISGIADQTIDEDTISAPIAFAIGDVDNAAGSLVVTATSDNQLILPDSNIVLSGTGANRTITLSPATNQFGGPLMVTVAVSDGVTNTQTTFQVTVQPVNDPPVLLNAQLTISEGQRVTLSSSHLSGTDVETNSDDLVYEVSNVVHGHFAREGDWSAPISTFNGAQLTNGEIVFIHDGGELAPAFDVRVGDGALRSSVQSASVSFTNTNDAPTISNIADQTILEDNSTGPLSFTLADVDSSLGALSVTATSSHPSIIPNSNLIISGSGTDWTIDVTPAASASGGPVTITVVASDGDLTSQMTFDVTITPVNDPPDIVSTSFSIDENAVAASVGFVQVNDPDSSDLTFSIAGGTGAGRFVIDATTGEITTVGSLDFETRSNYTLDVNVTDETGLTDLQSILILVNNINEAPNGSNDHYYVDQGEDLIVGGLGVLLNDIDVDSAVLTVILESDASHGSVTLNTTGSFTYIGDGTSSPIDQFTYRLTDGEFVTEPITVTIQLNAGGTTTNSGNDDGNTSTDSNTDTDSGTTEDNSGDSDSTTDESTDTDPNPLINSNNSNGEADSSTEDEDKTAGLIVLPTTITEVFEFVSQALEVDPTIEERGNLQSESFTLAADVTQQVAGSLQSLLTNWRTSTDSETVNRLHSTLNSQSLWQEWERVEEVIKSETSVAKLTHQSAAITVSGGLTVGYVLWTLRGGVLLTSLLAQMPAWKLMDPLVVLEHLEDISSEDDDSLESLVDRHHEDDILDEGEAEDV